MCWFDDLLAFWFPEPQRDKAADIPTTHPDSESYLGAQDIPLDIPECYLRPELIPIKEPDGAAVEEAERVLRR